MEASEWRARLERELEEKNGFFAAHWQSPVPPEERVKFRGLAYYPPNPDYKFELELHKHDEKKIVRMTYTRDNEGDFMKWGEFRFTIGGEEQALQAYKSDRPS